MKTSKTTPKTKRPVTRSSSRSESRSTVIPRTPSASQAQTQSKVELCLNSIEQWREELMELRNVVQSCELVEDFKWGWPCYTDNDKNIVLIHSFKKYCALLFFKGALMTDPDALLVQQTANVQAARHMRFTSVEEIRRRRKSIISYILEAVAVERSGLNVSMKPTAAFEVPEEFARVLRAQKKLQSAFEALTPGRQRAYLLHFSKAKQSSTRESRIARCIPRILAGKGLLDEL